jgi:hypothetical protein
MNNIDKHFEPQRIFAYCGIAIVVIIIIVALAQ